MMAAKLGRKNKKPKYYIFYMHIATSNCFSNTYKITLIYNVYSKINIIPNMNTETCILLSLMQTSIKTNSDKYEVNQSKGILNP